MRRLFTALCAALVALVLFSPRAEARFGFGPTQSTPFTPAGASPVAWYQHGVGITTATGVSAWTDSSGSGDANKNLAQATGSKQPTYTATDAAYNGQPTLTFSKTSGSNLASGNWAHAVAQPFTLVWVGQSDQSSTQGLVDDANNSQNACIFTTAANFGMLTNGGGNELSSGTAGVTTSPSIIVGVFNGATASELFLNGVAVAGGNAGQTPGTSGIASIVLGAIGGPIDSLNGKIAEVVVLAGAADLTTVAAIDKYYGNLFGIAVP